MITPRSMRLHNDYMSMQAIRSDAIAWEVGDKRNPPERYIIYYRLKGLTSPNTISHEHTVVIKLLAEYPSRPPYARFVSRPILFHPHVFQNGSICMGRYSPDEGLATFCLRIAKYIQFHPELIDTKSPANNSALNWFKNYSARLPVDSTLLPEPPA